MLLKEEEKLEIVQPKGYKEMLYSKRLNEFNLRIIPKRKMRDGLIRI